MLIFQHLLQIYIALVFNLSANIFLQLIAAFSRDIHGHAQAAEATEAAASDDFLRAIKNKVIW